MLKLSTTSGCLDHLSISTSEVPKGVCMITQFSLIISQDGQNSRSCEMGMIYRVLVWNLTCSPIILSIFMNEGKY